MLYYGETAFLASVTTVLYTLRAYFLYKI